MNLGHRFVGLYPQPACVLNNQWREGQETLDPFFDQKDDRRGYDDVLTKDAGMGEESEN